MIFLTAQTYRAQLAIKVGSVVLREQWVLRESRGLGVESPAAIADLHFVAWHTLSRSNLHIFFLLLCFSCQRSGVVLMKRIAFAHRLRTAFSDQEVWKKWKNFLVE